MVGWRSVVVGMYRNLYIYSQNHYDMKPILPLRFVLPVGLLLLFSGLLLNNFHLVPDFASGFLIGLGITLAVAAFIKKWHISRAD
jgi:hypothetical protein